MAEREQAHVAWADKTAFAFECQRAAAFDEVISVPVEIRAGDGSAPASPDVVGAPDPLAASAPVHEEVGVPIMLAEAGGFDGEVGEGL